MRVTRRDIPLAQLPSGHELSAPLLVIESERPGKTVYIQSGTHGGEVAGHGAIWELLSILAEEDLCGTLYLAPQVNPQSLAQKLGDWQCGVFDLRTGQNFNRLFMLLAKPGPEDPADPRVDVSAFAARHQGEPWPAMRELFKAELLRAVAGLRAQLGACGLAERDAFALAVQEIACQADVVLDLHTGDVAPRYAYVPPWRPAAMRALNVPFLLVNRERFAGALDEAVVCPWLMLAAALRARGRQVRPDVEGYTLELGSIETLRPDEMRADAARIANFLRAHGVLTRRPRADSELSPKLCEVADYVSYCAPDAGLCIFDKEPGQPVAAGETVARILRWPAVRDLARSGAVTPVIVRHDGILLSRHASPVVPRGQRLLRLMTRIETL